MTKKNQDVNEETIEELEEGELIKMEAPAGFEKIAQATEFLSLSPGTQIIARFNRLEEVGSTMTDTTQICWNVTDEQAGITGLLPEKATMRQFRDLLVPGEEFWLACTGKQKGKQARKPYYVYEFAVLKK